MRENKVKKKLAAGGTSLGAFMFDFSTPGSARIAAAAGAEYIIWDLEHTGWGTETIKELMAAARGVDIVAGVRVPATAYHLIAVPLDVGVEAVVIPNVKTREHAEEIVSYAKYPPMGNRGVGILYTDQLVDGDVGKTLEAINREQWVVAQIESVEGLENADAISAVDGIDVLWIGHYDLTTSMGIPGQFEHPDYLAAVEQLVKVCDKHDKALGQMVVSPEQGRPLLEQGFRTLAYGDIWTFEGALKSGLESLRS
jgi:2-keto-3-deoxy-L-rhamnonate aldolase RhmA